MDVKAQYAEEVAKRDAAQANILRLSAEMGVVPGRTKHADVDHRHPNYPKVQTAIRAFKRADGRCKRLVQYYAQELNQ